MTLVVEQPGLFSLVEDQGRAGLGHIGVSTSGAFDRNALRQVNGLLGNERSAAAIEVLGGGLVLHAERSHLLAVTGGVGPLAIDGDPVSHGRILALHAGQRLELGTITAGVRACVGVAGGFVVARELGSASTDTLAGLGPPALSIGDRLDVGTPGSPPDIEDVPSLGVEGQFSLDVILGPRDDWFTETAVRSLLEAPWQVSADSDRIGVRLTGPRLDRARDGELPSEPCLRGSIQVTSDRQPIVLGPDHPVTGGYPVIAVVIDAHTDRLSQARPGQTIRLHRRSLP